MSLQSVDDVQSDDSLSLGVFSVGNRVSDNIFKESLAQQDANQSFFDNSKIFKTFGLKSESCLYEFHICERDSLLSTKAQDAKETTLD